VYLWWTRLAAEEGLSVVDLRAGAAALTLSIQGALGRSVVEALAGLEIALGAALGLAAAALLRRRASTSGWVLGGLLAGTFAVHLAAGYVANLLEAAVFLAAAVALASETRRGTWVAAAMLGAAGLAHPLFLLVGAGVLVLTAALAWPSGRDESVRIGVAVLGGGVVAGAGLLALLGGPAPLDVDTSRDAFLRRAGLGGELRSAYLDRFVHRWARYVQWASIPLAALGWRGDEGFVSRFLRAWAVVTALGAGVGLATGWFPADRFVTFGFVVPILAALGLVRIRSRLGDRRVAAVAVAGALTVAMLAGAFIAWNRQEPFLSEGEVRAAAIAGAAVADVEPGTPLVFLVNEASPGLSFLATRAGNVIRASMPVDRIRDVVVLVPHAQGADDAERRALERLTADDAREAERDGGAPVRIVLRPFDGVDAPEDAIVVDESLLVAGDAPLEPSSSTAIAATGAIALLFLGLAGYGWARVAVPDPVTAAALAPAAGAGALVLAAVVLERLGVPLDAAAGAWAASALGGGGGYVAWRVLERRARARPAPEIHE
jgi:hypothetical protein